MIEQIENNESGASVRAKLNSMIDIANGLLVFTATTIDNTQTEMLLAGNQRAVVPVDTSWAFSILLLCRSLSGFSGVWKIEGGIDNHDGTVAMSRNWIATNPIYSTSGRFDPAKVSGIGIVTTVLAGDTSNTFGAPVVDADVANQSLRIRVAATNYAGGAAMEMRWKALVSIVQVPFEEDSSS